MAIPLGSLVISVKRVLVSIDTIVIQSVPSIVAHDTKRVEKIAHPIDA